MSSFTLSQVMPRLGEVYLRVLDDPVAGRKPAPRTQEREAAWMAATDLEGTQT
jgi:hypothetical protein